MSAPRTSKRVIALVNIAFVLGVICVLGGISLLLLAYGWYTLGDQMHDPAEWTHTKCLVNGHDLDQSSNNAGVVERVLFDVSYNSFPAAAATARLRAWGTPAQAQADIMAYPEGNTTACFCPVSRPNVWTDRTMWSIDHFCIFAISEADIGNLVFWFRLWFYLGIVLVVIGPILLIISVTIFVHTRCFKRRITLFRGGGRYQRLN